MKIITDLSKRISVKNPVITIGTFDGLHIGHRKILKEVIALSKESYTDNVVVTFNPHPRIVLGQEVSLLNTRDEKRQIIEDIGIDHLLEIPFTVEFSDLSADEFINLIVKILNPSIIVIGYDHGFGRDRSGNISMLEESGKRHGFKVIEIDAIEHENEKVSSSIIRTLLAEGNVNKAGVLLGKHYQIQGSVIRGNQIGKRIGYPTANLYLEDSHKLIPAMGVYASMVEFDGKIYKGMTNIGLRPTINAHQLTIETNIFNFDQDIYYERIKVSFIERIRNENKFDTLDNLRVQLKSDKEETSRLLEGYISE